MLRLNWRGDQQNKASDFKFNALWKPLTTVASYTLACRRVVSTYLCSNNSGWLVLRWPCVEAAVACGENDIFVQGNSKALPEWSWENNKTTAGKKACSCWWGGEFFSRQCRICLLYTSDAADERSSVDLGGRRIIKKKTNTEHSIVRLHMTEKKLAL